MTNYHVRASKSQKLDFTNDFKFTNIPVTYLIENQDEDLSILHPIIDKLLVTPAGEKNLGKIAALSSGTLVVFLICIAGANKIEECVTRKELAEQETRRQLTNREDGRCEKRKSRSCSTRRCINNHQGCDCKGIPEN